MVIPSSISDEEIVESSKFRHLQRFPALTFYDKKSGTSLWRSGQTTEGFSLFRSNRNKADEALLEAAMLTNSSGEGSKKISIFDLREHWFAFKKKFSEGGYENTNNYKNSELSFCNMKGFITVGKVYKKTIELCHNHRKYTDEQLQVQLFQSGWFTLQSYLLKAINSMVQKMRQESCVVLTHCTSGWDRTAQICAGV